MRNWKKILFSVSMSVLMTLSSVSGYAHPITNPSRIPKSVPVKVTQSQAKKDEVVATPQSDFYSYINAKWLNETKIPEGQTSVGNIAQLQEKTAENVKAIFYDLNKNYSQLKEGSDEKKLIDFYNMALDFKTRDAMGFKPIKAITDEVKTVKTISELNKVLEKAIYEYDVSTVMQLNVSPDRKDSMMTILYVEAPGISFDNQYLEGKDDYSKNEVAAQKQFMIDIFILNGDSKETATRKADLIYRLEIEQARALLSKEQKDDHGSQYNIMTWSEIKKMAPNLSYFEFAKAMKLDHAKKIVVSEPKAIQKTNELYIEKNLEAFKAQLEYKIITSNLSYLSKEGYNALVKYLKATTGVDVKRTDEELAFELTESKFSNLLAKVYVEKYFSATAKADVQSMVEDIKVAYAKHIKSVEWMSEATKEKALKKLDTLVVKIGYPDQWEDYSSVKIKTFKEGGNLMENALAINKIQIDKHLATLNKAPDRSAWFKTPHTVNAYYNPIYNEIVFPAAILQAPFYDANATKEQNLGGIGTVIAHEISHAFDRSGAQFDENGNLVDWWTKEDLAKFQVKVKQAADIYSKLEVLPGYYVNGEISTGEIAADLGGLTIAIDIAKEKGYDTKKVFEAYGQVWRELKTKEQMIADISDEHPPGKYRVNNIVNQLDQFYIDFNVKEGDPMYVKPADRLKIW